jgi:transcriptional regulator with XRE-family HTH domain
VAVGERIRRRRLELSKRVSYAYISRLEGNTRTASVKAMRKLAARLNVSAHWLETGELDPAEQLAQLVLDYRGRPLPTAAARLAGAVLAERRPPSGLAAVSLRHS